MRKSWLLLPGLVSAFAAGGQAGCLQCDDETLFFDVTEEDAAGLADGSQSDPFCEEHCEPTSPRGFDLVSCRLEAAALRVECEYVEECDSGRRPSRLELTRKLRSGSRVGDWFARSAELEAASVVAFVDLAKELVLHKLPDPFVRAALKSAREEARHHRRMLALARRFGGRVGPVRVAPFEPRSLEAIAVSNADDGCIGESLAGRLLALQARAAAAPDVRATFRAVAAEELAHGALSLELDRALRPRLSRAARSRVEDARRAAIVARSKRYELDPTPEERLHLGMPNAERSQTLLAALARP